MLARILTLAKPGVRIRIVAGSGGEADSLIERLHITLGSYFVKPERETDGDVTIIVE